MQTYDDLPTERPNPGARDLDRLPVEELVDAMVAEERRTPEAVAAASPEIARVVEMAAAAILAGGRIVYVGAGTSGRLGVLDAAECPPTFGTDPSRVVARIAGGREAVFTAREGAEDDSARGEEELRDLRPGPDDLVVGITASGTTPYVRGALAAAAEARARTALLTAGDPGRIPADVVVHLRTGPELIAGSTRLKAGTATKIVLNMISTGAMIRTGRVHDNLMVDLRAGSAKLVARANRLVRDLADLGPAMAARALDRAGGEVKTAVVMSRAGVGPEEARRRISEAGGFLRGALAAEEEVR